MYTHTELLLANQMGYQDIIIKSDALQIVSALCNFLPNGSLIGNIVEDSKAFLSTITEATAVYTIARIMKLLTFSR